MAKTTRTLITVAVMATACSVGARPATAGGDPRTIVLHVDDHAHLAPAELASAEVETTCIFAAAGVRATWEHGTVDPDARRDHKTHLAVVNQFPRVRSSDASITRIIEEATAGSQTFQSLVAAVERSDGIIHVEPGECRGRVASCLPTWMTSSGSQRFLRIIVDRRRIDSDRQLAKAIGHELQHVLEVLGNPLVTDSTKMLFFYQRYAPTDQLRFETPEAIQAGLAVADEWTARNRVARR